MISDKSIDFFMNKMTVSLMHTIIHTHTHIHIHTNTHVPDSSAFTSLSPEILVYTSLSNVGIL